MIIDLRTRIWTSLDQLGGDVASRLRRRFADRWEQLDGSTSAHERSMHCVKGAAIFGFRSHLLGAAVPNEVIAEFVAADSHHRIGIAGIDPMAPGALVEVEKSVQLGLSGIAISPAAQGFHPAHSAAMRIYERCDHLRLPVFITNDLPLASSAIMEFARPAAIDEVARAFPNLRIVIGELGTPWAAETLTLLSKHQNLFADIAMVSGRPWELYNVLLLAQGYDVLDRILFGSGFPFVTPESAIEAIYSINGFSQGTTLPSIPRSHLRLIVERDSLALLGVDHDMSARGETQPRVESGRAAALQLGVGRHIE